MCVVCHGIPGWRTAFPEVYKVPKLGGQYPDYMAKTLRDYKSGARKNAIMLGFAQGLSGQDIENVAAYYASQPAVLVTKH